MRLILASPTGAPSEECTRLTGSEGRESGQELHFKLFLEIPVLSEVLGPLNPGGWIGRFEMSDRRWGSWPHRTCPQQ